MALSAVCIREGGHDTVLYVVVALWALGLVKTSLWLLVILDLAKRN